MWNSKLVRTRVFVPAFAILVMALFVGYRFARGQETLDTYTFSLNSSLGRKTAVVPINQLNLKDKNPDLVFYGAYVVNVHSSCSQCHTCPSFKGLDPYKVGGLGLGPVNVPAPINVTNYLAGGTPFPNSTIRSPNLTPDSSGQPGGMSYADFKNAMQNGIAPHNTAHILQIMPWPNYRSMMDIEFTAIYQYLSSLPPTSPGSCTGPGQTGQ